MPLDEALVNFSDGLLFLATIKFHCHPFYSDEQA